MASRLFIVAIAFLAGAAAVTLMPGVSTTLQRAVGIVPGKTLAKGDGKPEHDEQKTPVIAMDDERIKLARIELATVDSGAIAKRLSVPGTVVPDADRVAHVSVKLSGTVAELRKKIGDDVTKGEVLAVLESREVADAKSEYLAARLANELQQDLAARDKSLWDGRAVPELQYIKSRNAAAQTGMRLNIARQKLLALGVDADEIAGLPQSPDALLRSQNVRASIAGRLAERKVELGTAVGRDNLETELFVIVDLSRVWVELSVSSNDLPLVKEGQSVRVSARGLSETAIAKVIFVGPLLDKETRTARVVAALDNAGGHWRPGSFVTAAIALSERRVDVVVPASALQNVDGGKVVFVRNKQGFEKRNVVPGEQDGQAIEVVSGVAAGETIAVSNTFSLKAELAKPRDED